MCRSNKSRAYPKTRFHLIIWQIYIFVIPAKAGIHCVYKVFASCAVDACLRRHEEV